MPRAPQSMRYRNSANLRKIAQIDDNNALNEAPEIWGDGDRIFRLNLLIAHMMKKSMDSVSIDDASYVMKLQKNTYEARRLLRSCPKKFDELSSYKFKILTVPKEKINILIDYMKDHNMLEIHINSASTVLDYSSAMAYKVITNNDAFEKSDRRGYYKFKGVEIDRVKNPEKKIETPKRMHNYAFDVVVDYMNYRGVFNLHYTKIASIMGTNKVNIHQRIYKDGRFIKRRGVGKEYKGMFQLLPEYRGPNTVQVTEEKPIEEPTKAVISEVKKPKEQPSRPKMDLLVNYLKENSMTEIHYVRAAEIMGCCIQSSHNNLRYDSRFRKLKRGVFGLFNKDEPAPEIKQPTKRNHKITWVVDYMNEKGIWELHYSKIADIMGVGMYKVHDRLILDGRFRKKSKSEPNSRGMFELLPEYWVKTKNTVDTEIQKEEPIEPVKELEPEIESVTLEKVEPPPQLIAKRKMAYYCPHCGKEVVVLDAEEIRQRAKAGIHKAIKEGKPFGRPRIKVDEDELIRLRLGGASEAKIAESMGVGKKTVQRIIKKLKGEGRI